MNALLGVRIKRRVIKEAPEYYGRPLLDGHVANNNNSTSNINSNSIKVLPSRCSNMKYSRPVSVAANDVVTMAVLTW